MFTNISFQHSLPDLACTQADCILDFNFREKTRFNSPGACSLEYMNGIKIIIEHLLNWDTVNQKSKGEGILGTVEAFGPAHEEQGRKTLHSHWQIWIKELNPKLRTQIFDKNEETRLKAKNEFIGIVDKLLHTSFGPELKVVHNCRDRDQDKIPRPVGKVFKEVNNQTIRNARHKTLCHKIGGKLMYCEHCEEEYSPTDIVNLALESWHSIAVRKGSKADVTFPLKSERLDIAAYTYSYHMDDGCCKEKDPFWGNKDVRQTLLRFKFDQHHWRHRPSCFKKCCECRFYLPDAACPESDIDFGGDMDDVDSFDYHQLVGDVLKMTPWNVKRKRAMGCQYINTHNKNLSEIFNCNTNIQLGDIAQVFYSTLYCGKSTQKEDSEKQQRMNTALNRRLLRIQGEVIDGIRKEEDVQDGFVEGLCRMLSAMNAATSRDVVSATMQHLLVLTGGDRFQFSHDFGNLLVAQLEARLDGADIAVRLRTNRLKGQPKIWQDAYCDDYLHRPDDEEFEDMCVYEMTMLYAKTYKTFSELRHMANQPVIANDKSDSDNDNSDDEQSDDGGEGETEEEGTQTETTEETYDTEDEGTEEEKEEDCDDDSDSDDADPEEQERGDQQMSNNTSDTDVSSNMKKSHSKIAFIKSHPGFHFSYLRKRTKFVIPKVYLPKDRLCTIGLLNLHVKDVDEQTIQLREHYAKMALLMFYPYRTKADLTIRNSHWKLFYRELTRHTSGSTTKFWPKGFQILQNMEDRIMLDKKMSRLNDELSRKTSCEAPDDDDNLGSSKTNIDDDEFQDILKFCNDR